MERSDFSLTTKQVEANKLLRSGKRHTMLYGGACSGKTFLLVRAFVTRAIKAAGSRHLIARYRFNHVNHSIGLDALPNVLGQNRRDTSFFEDLDCRAFGYPFATASCLAQNS